MNATSLAGGGASTTTTAVAGARGNRPPASPYTAAIERGGAGAPPGVAAPLLQQLESAIQALHEAMAVERRSVLQAERRRLDELLREDGGGACMQSAVERIRAIDQELREIAATLDGGRS